MKIHEDNTFIYVIPFIDQGFGYALQNSITIDKAGVWSKSNSFSMDISIPGIMYLNESRAKEYGDSILKAVEIVSKMKEKGIKEKILENGIVSESEIYVKED